MPTANEQLRDLMVSRGVRVLGIANRNVRELTRILETALKAARRELPRQLEIVRLRLEGKLPVPLGGLGDWRVRQLEYTIGVLEAILADAYRQIGRDLERRLLTLSEAEAEAALRALTRVVPKSLVDIASLEFHMPSAELLTALVTKRPMHGGQIGAYFAKEGKKSLVKQTLLRYRKFIEQEVATGLLLADSIDTVTRRVHSKVRKVARWQLRSVVDTATKHVAGEARQAFLDANAGPDGVVKGHQWLSTIDLHTTVEWCIPRDGLVWDTNYEPIGHGYEWGAGPKRIHWGCRSDETAVLKSWEELGVDANELERFERAGDQFRAGNVTQDESGRWVLTDKGRDIFSGMDGIPAPPTNVRDWMASRTWTEEELVEVFGRRRTDRILESDDVGAAVSRYLRRLGVRAAA